MSNSKSSQAENDTKRNLPSWMKSRAGGKKSSGKNGKNDESNEDKGNNNSKEISSGRNSKGPNSNSSNFSKLLEGVVFVLSGFVNPERATLRSQALEMGAEYLPDWSSECTLLVCAYNNTPKFRQVEAECGTIVRKEWILDCYSQKKLVEIDSYLIHAGKPWRNNSITTESSCDKMPSPPRKSEKQVERGSHSKPTAYSCTKSASTCTKDHFSPSRVKEWAVDDLNRTISWLESQEEKPEPSEIKQIAAGGIVICLQDAIDALEQNQDVHQIAEQWNVVPHAIEELIKLLDAGNSLAPLSKEDLCRQAKACKEMYETELDNIDNCSTLKKRRLGTDEIGKASRGRPTEYDSDETIEMTEDEIDLAYNKVAKCC